MNGMELIQKQLEGMTSDERVEALNKWLDRLIAERKHGEISDASKAFEDFCVEKARVASESIKMVGYLPYRTGRVLRDNCTSTLNGNIAYETHWKYAREAAALKLRCGDLPDNHECYIWDRGEGDYIGVWFHDCVAYYGKVTLADGSPWVPGLDRRKLEMY